MREKMTYYAAAAYLLAQLFILTGCVTAGELKLNPVQKKIFRLAGEENSFFISCTPESASGGPVGDSRVRAKELRWTKLRAPPVGDGSWVTMGTETHERVHVEESGDGRGLDLVFRVLRPEDGGMYGCEAELDGEELKSEFELKIIEPISFNREDENQTVEVGTRRFILKCDVQGNPRPRVTWNLRGQVVRGGSEKHEVSDEGLVIYNVSESDGGTYKCKATQIEEGITDFQDMVISLTVQHKPEWPADQRGKFYGYISGLANLSCEARAEPKAEFRWLDKENNQIESSEEIKIWSEGHISHLVLPILHEKVFGDYTCIAENKMGTLRKVVTLAEGAKPGVPNLNIQTMGHNYAQLKIEDVSRQENSS